MQSEEALLKPETIKNATTKSATKDEWLDSAIRSHAILSALVGMHAHIADLRSWARCVLVLLHPAEIGKLCRMIGARNVIDPHEPAGASVLCFCTVYIHAKPAIFVRAVPCRAVPCRAVPWCAVLCCAVLCCAMLCCAVLC